MVSEPKTKQPKITLKKPSKRSAKAKLTKGQIILRILKTKNSASVPELMKITQWKNHSVRAALSGLGKTGLSLIIDKQSGKPTRYRVEGDKGGTS
jgi:predicted HTH transcriptional regulator